MLITDPNSQTTPAETSPTSANPHTKSGVSHAEAATLAEWAKDDLAKRKLTPEAAEKIFTQLNVPIDQRGPDQRTDEQKTLDQHFPAAKPEDYRITYEDVPMTPELKQFDQSARTWLSAAGFPRDTGNSLVSAISRVSQATQHMTEGELEAYGQKEFEKLQRVHGEKLDERLQAAARMVHALDLIKPGLKALLKSRGIGDNALVASLLIQQAARYHARRGR